MNTWKIIQDSDNDSIQRVDNQSGGYTDVVGGTSYEIYVMGYIETTDSLVFAINSNLPNDGISNPRAEDNNVKWGDLILNFSGTSLDSASGSLYGVKFIPDNDSGVNQVGIYSNVTVKSVTADNGLLLTQLGGSNSQTGYNPYVRSKDGNPQNGELGPDDPYFNQGERIDNVINSGNLIGEVLTLTAAELSNLGFNSPDAVGSHTIGISIPKELLPVGNFTAHLSMECGNDIVAIRGEIIPNPCIDIEKSTNGVDADTLETAPAIAEGETVTWTYEVTNCGNIPFAEADVVVIDDQGVIPVLDRSSDAGQDGILSPGETWTYTATGIAEPLLRTVDFDTDAAGNPLDEGGFTGLEYTDWGLTISRLGEAEEVENGLALVDSSSEDLYTADSNTDLGTPNENYGGPGRAGDDVNSDVSGNTEALDNVLVLLREGATVDRPTDQFDGGTFLFELATPQTVKDMSFLDMDANDRETRDLDGDLLPDAGIIYAYDEAGVLIGQRAITPLGNNSFQTVDLDFENVSSMKVTFVGSGAITGLSFGDYYQNIGTVTVPGASDDDPSHYVPTDPDIDIEKYTNVNGTLVDADFADTPATANPGEIISWQYHVTNTGNVAFNADQVTVTDDDPNVVLTFAGESGVADGILSPGEVWYYTGTYQGITDSPLFYTVDFDTDAQGNAIAEGELVRDQYADWGLTISTTVPQGKDYGATVLNSSNPNPYDKNDDMVTDTENNVLIHSRYENNQPPKTTDRFDGGTFIFEWEDPVDIGAMQFLDIEADEDETVVIRTFDADGNLIDESLIEGEENGGLIDFDINDRGVARMEVDLNGSGAITDFNFSRPYRNTATVTVTANDGDKSVSDSYTLIDRDHSHVRLLDPTIADFNRDSFADVVTRNQTTGENQILHLEGSRVVTQTALATEIDQSWQIQGIADFDGDGRDDLVWRNRATGQNVTWLDGDRQAGQFLTSESDLNWEICGVGDFDGDGGADDLVWRHRVTGQNAVWFMDNFQRTGGVMLDSNTDLNNRLAAVGDFNGDGQDDLIWRNAATGSNRAWLMDGVDVAEVLYLQSEADLNWQIQGVADYNKDGHGDLLWQHAATGEGAVWAMTGAQQIGGAFLQNVGSAGLASTVVVG